MNAEYISNGIKKKFQVGISYKKEIQYQNSSLFSLTAHRGGQRILIYPIHTLNHESFFVIQIFYHMTKKVALKD